MSEARTVEEIEAEIARTRIALQSTIDELTHRVDPRAQVADLKERATEYGEKAKEYALDTVEKAKAGSLKEIGILTGVACATLLCLGLLFKR
ncbi:hypothetical protein HMPREF0044_0319 [Gleimia coleocanis DSM 15436]|uniref:DUF3618 domain-containing protein n=1 Tax=Gleimia coleocanis DSM 15436 TaxID=525245 RepID=C0VYS9_9ACTO|nr:DUF3618 domain-containing protein [Gleimia coleocanis]EEH64582.1 hypothetical protein HMPREF0044_0319 [Gleimia coleocanis DSM 15436]